jgi:hypothetical protein
VNDSVNNDYAIKSVKSSPQSQLDNLYNDLQAKREAVIERGLVEDLPVIEEALVRVESARKELRLKQQVTNSAARLGNYRNTENGEDEPSETTTISSEEAEQISRFNSVPSIALRPGERFTNMNSLINYTITNRDGLFSLLAAKES